MTPEHWAARAETEELREAASRLVHAAWEQRQFFVWWCASGMLAGVRFALWIDVKTGYRFIKP